MLPGTGSAKLNRWYFNQASRQCLQFTYTGRGGNQNSFLGESDCAQRCPGIGRRVFGYILMCSVHQPVRITTRARASSVLFGTDGRFGVSRRLLVSCGRDNAEFVVLCWR
jgi:hypothetical protein